MAVQKPGSSVLKPGVRDKQRELETVIGKYELLLAIGRAQHPDFGSIDVPPVIFRLAESRLCLVRLQRTTWQIDLHERDLVQIETKNEDDKAPEYDSMETILATLQDMLKKTRQLYKLPEVADTNKAVQGEVQVLLEVGELLTFCEDRANAMAAYAEAVRLCYNIEDEATEAILVASKLTSKLQKLQRQADAMARMESTVVHNSLIGNNDAESEKSKLKAAFDKIADPNGFLSKEQLQTLSEELGMRDVLSISEVDEIWEQIKLTTVSDSNTRLGDGQSLSMTDSIAFETLWGWWVSEAMYDYMMSDT